ncbi:hypothetical protein [Methanosphaera sp.]
MYIVLCIVGVTAYVIVSNNNEQVIDNNSTNNTTVNTTNNTTTTNSTSTKTSTKKSSSANTINGEVITHNDKDSVFIYTENNVYLNQDGKIYKRYLDPDSPLKAGEIRDYDYIYRPI